jgi:hypothetical protein
VTSPSAGRLRASWPGAARNEVENDESPEQMGSVSDSISFRCPECLTLIPDVFRHLSLSFPAPQCLEHIPHWAPSSCSCQPLAPSGRIRGDQNLRAAARRQVGLERIGIDGEAMARLPSHNG